MPRTTRALTGGICCHVTNRGNGRMKVFHGRNDYSGFVELMDLACRRVPMRVVGCCLMPNHFHLLVWPHEDGDLARWMQWLMTSHVRRYHGRRGTSGHVWQGRFKSFPIQRRRPTAGQRAAGVLQTEDPVLAVLRYAERNPVRAGLVKRAEDWPWSSLAWWLSPADAPQFWRPEIVLRPRGWLAQVNRAEDEAALAAVHQSTQRGSPFGTPAWTARIVRQLGLESTVRPRGRPKKTT